MAVTLETILCITMYKSGRDRPTEFAVSHATKDAAAAKVWQAAARSKRMTRLLAKVCFMAHTEDEVNDGALEGW